MRVLGIRVRWPAVAVLCLALLGFLWKSSAASTSAGVAGRTGSSALSSCSRAVRRLGRIALVARGRLEMVDLAHCRVTVRSAPGATEVRFSPNGRWLAYARLPGGYPGPSTPSGPEVIPVLAGAAGSPLGGAARSPLEGGVLAWTWSPSGALLYGITRGGSLVSAAPDGSPRVVAANVVPISYGYYGQPLPVSPDRQLAAVDRSACAPSTVGELDTVNLRTGALTVVVRKPGAFFTLAGFSPDGRWLLFWAATQCSGSLDADGWPLDAVRASGGSPVRVVAHMLLYDDFLTWCGSDLIAAAGPDRQSNQNSELLSAAPPAWHAHAIDRAGALSWVSPVCAPGGRSLAAAAGPNTGDAEFGVEHRSIWLLRAGTGASVRRLTLPPAPYLSDEAPRFSRGGRWVMFVRSRVLAAGSANSSRDTIELVRSSGDGLAVPILSFTSDDFSYYDHFDWPSEVDWSQPR